MSNKISGPLNEDPIFRFLIPISSSPDLFHKLKATKEQKLQKILTPVNAAQMKRN